MPDNTQQGGPEKSGAAGGGSGIPEDELAGRLRALDKRLDRGRDEKAAGNVRNSDRAGMAMALRMATDFVAAVLVGAALGWGADRLLGTAPWGMIALLLLGFCAGVLNVLRTAGRIADPHAGRAPAGRPEMYDDEE